MEKENPFYSTTITLPICPTDDPEITCVMCGQLKCDLEIYAAGNGRKVWSGLHTRCWPRNAKTTNEASAARLARADGIAQRTATDVETRVWIEWAEDAIACLIADVRDAERELERERDWSEQAVEAYKQEAAKNAKPDDGEAKDAAPRSVPMILTCPACGVRHVDEGEFATKTHHTHACQKCGMVWRPAIGPTCGVQFLPGFKNEASKNMSVDIENIPRPDGVTLTREEYERFLKNHAQSRPIGVYGEAKEVMGHLLAAEAEYLRNRGWIPVVMREQPGKVWWQEPGKSKFGHRQAILLQKARDNFDEGLT